jgi:predicted transcriptional regulator
MLIAFFIFIAVSGESSYASATAVLRGIRVADLMTRKVSTVDSDMRVSELIERMFEQRHLGFPVVDPFNQVAGFVSLQDVRNFKASGLDENTTLVEAIMSRAIVMINENASALEAFQLINQSESGRLVVMDSAGRLRGIVSKTDLVRAVQLANLGSEIRE